jgi:hypothetical protein
VLGICPRGNHRDDDIVIVSMIYYVFIEYPLKTTCIDWQLCQLFVKLFYLYGYSKVVPNRSFCEDTHMNNRLAHILVDDYVSQVMDIEMSN